MQNTWTFALIFLSFWVLQPALAAEEQGVTVYPSQFFAQSRPATAYDMITRLPGFNFDGGNSARGLAGTAGNVLVDGARPIAKNDSLSTILQRIPASSVERIEVIRGGAANIDMQGQSVLANVIRKTGASNQLVLNGQVTYLGSGQWNPGGSLEYHGSSGGLSYEATIARLAQQWDDGPGVGYRLLTPAGGPTERDHAQSWGIMRFGYSLHGAVTAPLFGGAWDSNLTLQTTDYSSGIAYDGAGGHWRYPSVTAERSGEFGSHWQGKLAGLDVEISALQRLDHREDTSRSFSPTDNAVFLSRKNTGESVLRLTARYPVSPALGLEGGGEIAYNYLDGHSLYVDNAVPVALPNANLRVDEKRGEAFGTATWKIIPSLSLEAGARFEFSTLHESGDTQSTRDFFYPKPRLLLSWSPDDRTQLRLRVERVLGQLDFGNFVAASGLSSYGVQAGGADLRPDQRWQMEVAAERHFWGKGALVVSFLHEEIKDLQDYIPVSATLDAPGNIPHATSQQITIGGTIPLDFLGITNGLLTPNLYWTDSEVRDPVTGEMRRISGQRDINSYYNFTQDIDAWSSTWGISWGTSFSRTTWRMTEIGRVAIHNNPLLNVFWSYKPEPAWKITLGADNFLPYRLELAQADYPGPRNLGGVPRIQETYIRTMPRIYLQIRASF